MATFGVNSEVGKFRKVIVHRPDLSMKRLTPSNHDELLYDDVIWVERAQWEHDQFVKAMRDRGIEVFYHLDLLAEALKASTVDARGLSNWLHQNILLDGHWWMKSGIFFGRCPRTCWPSIWLAV